MLLAKCSPRIGILTRKKKKSWGGIWCTQQILPFHHSWSHQWTNIVVVEVVIVVVVVVVGVDEEEENVIPVLVVVAVAL